MKKLAATLVLLVLKYIAIAQLAEGTVIDSERKNSISGVTIINKRTGIVTSSDSNGYYTIGAEGPDTLVFRHTAYQSLYNVVKPASGNNYPIIFMRRKDYSLKEAIVTGRSKFQQDSVEKHTLYEPELHKTLVPKPEFTMSNGIGCAGCVGWLADKLTGNSKKTKRFRKKFAEDDKSSFIDTRYTPGMVSSLTAIADTDSIAAFMNKYKMDYDFARSASELEIKMWIRDNYRHYIQKGMASKE